MTMGQNTVVAADDVLERDEMEDLEGTLPSSQYSERGDLLIPSTVLIQRMREEQEYQRLAQAGATQEVYDSYEAMEQSQVNVPEPGPLEIDGKMDVDLGNEASVQTGNNQGPALPPPSSPLPPSSFCFEMPESTSSDALLANARGDADITAKGPEGNDGEAKEMVIPSDDMDGGDEFDDPWFDAACLAEVDEGDTVDEAQVVDGEEDVDMGAGTGERVTGGTKIKDESKPKKTGGAGGFFTAGGHALPDVSAAAKARIQDMFKDEDLSERIDIRKEGAARVKEEEDDLFDKMDDGGFDDLLDEGPAAGVETVDAADYDPFAEVGGFLDPGAFGDAGDSFGFGGGVAGAGGAGGGFTTAKGKKLAAPSAAAAARAMKLFADEVVDEPVLIDEGAPASVPPKVIVAAEHKPSVFGFATAGGVKLAPPSAAAKAAASALFAEDENAVPVVRPAEGSTMFATAAGNKLSQPTAATTAMVARLFAEDPISEMNIDGGFVPLTPTSVKPNASATASGVKLPPPSTAASEAISMLSCTEEDNAVNVERDARGRSSKIDNTGVAVDQDLASSKAQVSIQGARLKEGSDRNAGPNDDSTGSEEKLAHAPAVETTLAPDTVTAPALTFATGSGGSLSAISDEAKARAAAIFAEEGLPETPKLKRTFELASSPSAGPLRDTTNTPRRTAFRSPTMKLGKPYGRPDETPLKQSAGFARTSVTPLKASPLLAKRVGIGLGMTPRAKNTLAMRPKFNSPLKKMAGGGVAPVAKVGHCHAPSLLGPATRDRKASTAVATERSCFDMNTRPPRQDMLASHLHPHYFSIGELMELDIPEEIWTINPANARYYLFMVDDVTKGPDDALVDMQSAGCLRATSQWVSEHWTMILWKLASLIRAKPDLFAEKWTYHEVFRQLLYRYEREMNLAHRSAIKRIQEQDSPASLPMVLCVSAIVLPEPAVDEDGRAIEVHPVLELADGWYRIRANTDATLGRAILANRLQVGYKIAIIGARLDASREGTEVLEAIGKSRLSISGNSTSMAEWSTKLGFVKKPFIASLPSLTKDGGVIAMMDIRIKKVFPLAYMSSKRGEHVAPWTAAEEFTQQDQWKEKYSQERTRLTQDLQARIALLEDDVGRVNAASEGLTEGTEIDDAVDGEVELERYRQTVNKATYLRGLRPNVLCQLSMALQRDYSYECEQGVLEIETQMQRLCPVRETRSFQVIRFEDSQIYQKERCRIGQLQVWDAHTLGDGALAEGMRFMISNLVPAQAHAWCGPRDQGEIFLSTKRDTIWRRLEET